MQSRLLRVSFMLLLTAAGLAKMPASAGIGGSVLRCTTQEFADIRPAMHVGPALARKESTGFLPLHNDNCDKVEVLAAARCLNRLGMKSLGKNDLSSAQDYYERALAKQQGFAHNVVLGESLNGLATTFMMRGEPQAAGKYFREASEILQMLGTPHLKFARSLWGRAGVDLTLGDSSQAEGYLHDAFTIQQKRAQRSPDIADTLHSMGDLYLLRADPAKALGFYQRALRIRKKVAPDSLDVALSLSALGAVAHRREHDAVARKYQLQALALREKLAPDSLVVADSFVMLGICCENDLVKAQSWFEKALAIQRRLAPDSLLVARNLTIIANFAEYQGNLDQAETYQQEALAIYQRLAPGSLLFSYSLLQVGELATDRGDLDRAEEYLEKALSLMEKKAPESALLTSSLTSLGALAQQRGNLIDAERYYRRSLSIRQKLKLGSLAAAINLRQLGQIASERGDLAAAGRYHQEALAIRESAIPGSLEVANSLYDLGSVSLDNNDLAKAEGYYRRSLALWNKIVPGSHYVALGLRGLGMLSQAHEDWVGARGWLQQALLIRKRIAPGSLEVGQDLSALGEVSHHQGDFAAAETYYRESLAITEKIAPASADHAQTLASLASILKNKQPDDAEQFYEKSLTSIETQMTRLGGSEEIRSGFRAKRQSDYKNYVDLLIARNKPDVAFEVSERLRARSLLENLAIAGADIRKGVDPVLLQQERSLESSITAKRERRVRLISGKHADEQLAAIDKEIEKLLKQQQDVAGEIRSTSPVYAALTQPQPMSAKEVQQQLLDANTALLEYSLGAEHSYVFVLNRDSVAVFELPKNAEIEAVARPVYDILTARSQVRKGETEAQQMVRLRRAEAQYPEAAHRLSQMILGPVAPLLGGKRLLIVSDGILQYVPFSALPAPREEATFVPLIANHEIVSLPSASVLQVLKQESAGRPRPPREVAVLADPVFSAADERVRPTKKTVDAYSRATQEAAKPSSFSRDLLLRSAAEVGVGDSASRFPRLFFSKREAEAILRQSSVGKTELAVDFRASRATATSPDLAQYRIIHFATHGLLNSEHPELSGLVLSLVDQRGRPQDGFLTLADIYNLNLQAEMVVLSACETGLGKEIKGEGLVGITRGFMYAGASRVVASLWKVDDAATAELMEKFYEGILKEGLQPAAALRKAQVEMWRQKRWSFPYYWAGFLMQGQW
ncbi:MAG TPA: CHAT domain-containing protein [Candidatus Angelobacter sp.]|jgi:CHAT domain-containing protein|nr:CHAT domain-containing protein [Candidatus Angelobacter sp.]